MRSQIKRLIFRLLLTLVFCALFLPGNGTPASAKGSSQAVSQASTDFSNIPTDQIIISYKASSQALMTPAAAYQMTRLTQAAGVALEYVRSMVNNADVYKLPRRLPLADMQLIAEKLAALSDVAYAEPDQIRFPVISPPNDTYYASGTQWDLNDPTGGINIQPAWDITTGSSSIVVAIGDTGLTNHADLAGRMVSGNVMGSGYDFINTLSVANDGNLRDSDPSDPGDWIASNECYSGSPAENSSWHGTHVAGTIGAISNNSQGVAGINWNSKLLIVRVLGKCGGYDSDIIDGISWAAGLTVSGIPVNANPAKVINLSLGGSGSCSTAWQTAVNNITAAGAVLVVAAGNSNANVSGFTPASCNGVIAVAATGKTGSRASYSNYGALVKISAPGGSGSYSVLSTVNSGSTNPVVDPAPGTYAGYQGTSMATPHITGVVSLMFSVNPTLTPAQVLSILQGTARAFPSGSTCTTSTCGSGIVDAGAAIAAARPSDAFSKTSPANGATGQPTSLSLNWGTSTRATSYSYCIDTTNNSACDGSWVSVGNTTNASVSGLLTNTTYYWEVRASNGWVDTYADSNTWGSFTTASYTLSVSKSGTGSGGVTSAPPGINCGTTCSVAFSLNTSVTLTGAASTGSTFTGWSGACTGTGTCTVTMDATKSVTATFTLNTYALNVSKSGTGSGTITSAPTGINCGTTCSVLFNYPTSVILTAVASTGSTFTGWSGACTGTSTCTVTMDAPKSVIANFTLNTYTLTVSKSGNGSGGVTSAPAGIDCGITCSFSFDYPTGVILTAAAGTGSTFTGWSGACTGTGTCSVTMSAARSVTATFTLIPYTLSVSKTGTGSGGVTSFPNGIDCGATCSAPFNYPASVTLTAAASTGSTFTGWSGSGCSGTGTCTVAMDAAKAVSADFTLNTYTLSIVKTGIGIGAISSLPTGIDCGSTCSYLFTYNTVVILTTTPTSPSVFGGWSGAGCSGFGTCTFAITADTLVTANFTDLTWTIYLPIVFK